MKPHARLAEAGRFHIRSAVFRPVTQLCVASGAGARSREEVRLMVRRWREREGGARWGVWPGELGRSQELRKMYWRCAVQTTLAHAVFQPWISLCLSVRWHMENQVSAQRVLVQPQRQAVAELAGDGLLVRCLPLPLETSEWVPEADIIAASHEVGGFPNPKGSRCLVRNLHVPRGCNGKVKGGQTPAAKNCRHFSSL